MIGHHKITVVMASLLIAITAFGASLRPLLLTALIDKNELEFLDASAVAWLKEISTIYLVLGLEISEFLLALLLSVVLSRFSSQVGKDWRVSLSSVMTLNMSGHAGDSLARFVTLTKSYVDTIEVFFRLYFFQTIGSVLQLVLAIFMASSLNGVVGALLFVETVVLFLSTTIYSSIHVKLAKARLEADEKLLGNASLNPRKGLAIWFGGLGSLWLSERKKEVVAVEVAHRRIGIGEGSFFAVTGFIIGFWVIVGYFVIIHFFKSEHRDFIAFFIYSGFMMGPVHRLSSFLHEYREYALSRNGLSAEVARGKESKNARTVLSQPLVFSTELRVVKENKTCPTLSFGPNHRLALLGHSGSGKTTALETLLGARTSATTTISGLLAENVRFELPNFGLRYLIDTPVFEAGTIRFNCQCSTETFENIVRHYAIFPNFDVAEICEFLDRKILSSGEPLSLGERQRVQLVRALAANPKVLFLDEALSGIEEELERKIVLALIDDKSIETIVYVGHRKSIQDLFTDRYVIGT